MSFLGARVDAKAKTMIRTLRVGVYKGNIDRKRHFRRVLERVVSALTNEPGAREEEVIEELAQSIDLSIDVVLILYGGLLYVLRKATRNNIPTDALRCDLTELKFPEECLADLCQVYTKSKDVIRERSTIEDALSRAVEPTVLMELTTSTGRTITVELTKEKFESLRFEVARVLADIHHIEAMPILKLDK